MSTRRLWITLVVIAALAVPLVIGALALGEYLGRSIFRHGESDPVERSIGSVTERALAIGRSGYPNYSGGGFRLDFYRIMFAAYAVNCDKTGAEAEFYVLRTLVEETAKNDRKVSEYLGVIDGPIRTSVNDAFARFGCPLGLPDLGGKPL